MLHRLTIVGLVVLSSCSQTGLGSTETSPSAAASGRITADASPTPTTVTPSALLASLGEPGAPGCDPPSPTAPHPPPQDWLTEAQGSSETQELWALFFSPPQVGEPVKIVWRMTGEGDFSVVATHESGAQAEDQRGPIAHLGSDWKRPGQEWGTFFTFPEEGCWEFMTRRGDSVGYLWVNVRAKT